MITQEIIDARRAEVAQYATNIAMYQAIASTLPSEYPEHLAHLKDSKNRHEDIKSVTDLADVELLGDLWAYDDAQSAIRSETIEMRKSQAILAFLESQV